MSSNGSWWCSFGFHDWESVACIAQAEISRIVNQTQCGFDDLDWYERKYFEKRVCLCCGQVDDQIARETIRMMEAKGRRESRKQQANELVGARAVSKCS